VYFFTTNQFLQVPSCQIKTTHHPISMENLSSNASHDVDDGEDEFYDGERV